MNYYLYDLKHSRIIHGYLVDVVKRSWNPIVRLWAWLQVKRIERVCGVSRVFVR